MPIDLSASMVELTLAWFDSTGRARTMLWDHTLPEATISDPKGCGWDPFGQLLDRMVEVHGEAVVVEGLAGAFIAAGDHPVIRRMLRSVADPLSLYRLLGVLGPRNTPCLRGDLRRLGDRRIQITLTLDRPGARPNEVYFKVTQSAMARMPQAIMGLAPSTVTRESDGLQAVYTVVMPHSRSVRSRLYRSWLAFRGTDGALDLIEESNNRLLKAHEELESQVTARTAELAALNTQLAEASATKSRHLADMSHELRTPINAILGYTEMLAEQAEEQDLQDLLPDLARVEKATRHLLTLVDNVLDLSRIEAGRMPITPTHVDLAALAPEVLVTVQPVLDKNDNTVVLDVAEGTIVYADPHRVRQILVNLLGNAGKFTTNGTITLRVHGTVVEVEDTGIGMSAEQLERLFIPFEQSTSRTMESFGGTGLGMAISSHLARLMNGQLTASSVLGKGSRFRLTLPAAELTPP